MPMFFVIIAEISFNYIRNQKILEKMHPLAHLPLVKTLFRCHSRKKGNGM
jgi:hypothetical protein